MKIQELFHIDKALKEKKQELERLRKETEELKLIMEINNKEISSDLVDITNVMYLNINIHPILVMI